MSYLSALIENEDELKEFEEDYHRHISERLIEAASTSVEEYFYQAQKFQFGQVCPSCSI